MSDFEIKLYKIRLTNGSHTAKDGTGVKFSAILEISGTHKTGSSKLVKVFFLSRNSPVPNKNGYRAGNDDWLYAPIEEMPVYIDLLRNEKPTWIRVDINDAANTELCTVAEEAGEGE